MRYKLDVVTDESYLKSGRYVFVDASGWKEALEKSARELLDGEWASRVVETEKRPGEDGLRIVWDITCGEVGYYD